jgi:hypothetical protein
MQPLFWGKFLLTKDGRDMSAQAMDRVETVDCCPGGLFCTITGVEGQRLVFVPTRGRYKGPTLTHREMQVSKAGYIDEITPYRPDQYFLNQRPLNDSDRETVTLDMMEGAKKVAKAIGVPCNLA